jgi:hypothetical protein
MFSIACIGFTPVISRIEYETWPESRASSQSNIPIIYSGEYCGEMASRGEPRLKEQFPFPQTTTHRHESGGLKIMIEGSIPIITTCFCGGEESKDDVIFRQAVNTRCFNLCSDLFGDKDEKSKDYGYR